MDDPQVITAEHWLEKALQERQAAIGLAERSLWSQSFYHAGFAVECALKYLIMKRRGLNAWPERTGARELFTHDLLFLAKEAGVTDALAAEIDGRTKVGLAWLIAKDWKNELRYDPLPFPEQRARHGLGTGRWVRRWRSADMADRELMPDEGRRRLGRETLALADRIGLAPDGAAWIRDAEANHWVLEFATPMIDTQGPDWVYRRLVDMVQHLALPAGITLLEVRLASPQERLWQVVTHLVTTDGDGVDLSGNTINGVQLPDMILYRARRSPEPVEQRVATFDRRYQELMAA